MRIAFLSFFTFLSCVLFYTSKGENKHVLESDASPSLIIVVLNNDDCRNCLKHGYSLLNELLEKYDHKKQVIILLSEKRQESMDIEKAELSSLLNLEKVTLLWNDELSEKVRAAAKLNKEMSSIVVFNKKASKFVYAMPLKKVVSFQELESHLK